MPEAKDSAPTARSLPRVLLALDEIEERHQGTRDDGVEHGMRDFKDQRNQTGDEATECRYGLCR